MKKAFFLPRALILFLVFLVIGAGIYRFAYHHYKNIAEWESSDSQQALLYEEDTFLLAGKIGDENLSAKKFSKEEVLGEVTPQGWFDNSKPFVVWSVEGKANFLIVTKEAKDYLYYRKGVDNPAKPASSATAETETVAG